MAESKLRYTMSGIVVGFAAGLILLDKTAENQRLTAELDDARATLAELEGSRPRARSYVRQGPLSAPRDSTGSSPPSRDVAGVTLEITDEDRVLMEDLEWRQRNGEYINRFEDPLQRKVLLHSISNGVEMLAPMNRAILTPVFAELGVSWEAREQLLAHVSKINAAAMETEASLSQLLKARWDYDKRVRSLLSQSDYESYKQFEASGPARAEFANIHRFAEQEYYVVPEHEREDLLSIIQQAEAYTTPSYLGPYDGFPIVAVGKDNVLRNAEELLAGVVNGANRALQLADERGLSEESMNLLFNYYNQDAQNRFEEIERIRDPRTEERIRAEVERLTLEGRQMRQP